MQQSKYSTKSSKVWRVFLVPRTADQRLRRKSNEVRIHEYDQVYCVQVKMFYMVREQLTLNSLDCISQWTTFVSNNFHLDICYVLHFFLSLISNGVSKGFCHWLGQPLKKKDINNNFFWHMIPFLSNSQYFENYQRYYNLCQSQEWRITIFSLEAML